jgi:hypothetical protein
VGPPSTETRSTTCALEAAGRCQAAWDRVGSRPTLGAALVDHALRILDAVVRFEHPTLDEPHPADPASLRAARRVLAASCSLRRELRRYRIAALDALDTKQDELPF